MFALYVGAGAFFLFSLYGSDLSPAKLIDGLPNMFRLLGEMFPPSAERLAGQRFEPLRTGASRRRGRRHVLDRH